MAEDGNPNGDGEGEGGDEEVTLDLTNPKIKSQVDAMLEQQTKGLKSKVNELLGKVKNKDSELQDYRSKLEELGGDEGIQRAQQVLEQLEADEDKELWKQGRVGDLKQKWQRQVSEKSQTELNKLQKKLEDEAKRNADEQKRADVYRSKIADNHIASNVRAEVAKREFLYPSVADDALAVIRVNKLVSYDPDTGEQAIFDDQGQERDGIDLGGLIEELAKGREHWVKPSAGGGANGGKGGFTRAKPRSQMTAAEKAAYLNEHGREKFMQLPA